MPTYSIHFNMWHPLWCSLLPTCSFTPCRKMEKSGLTKENGPNSFGGNQSLFFKTWHQASGQEGVSSECWRQKVPKDVDALIRSLVFFEVKIWSFLSWFGLFCLCRKRRNWSCKKTTVIWRWDWLKLVFWKIVIFLFVGAKWFPTWFLSMFQKAGKNTIHQLVLCVCVCVFWNHWLGFFVYVFHDLACCSPTQYFCFRTWHIKFEEFWSNKPLGGSIYYKFKATQNEMSCWYFP